MPGALHIGTPQFTIGNGTPMYPLLIFFVAVPSSFYSISPTFLRCSNIDFFRGRHQRVSCKNLKLPSPLLLILRTLSCVYKNKWRWEEGLLQMSECSPYFRPREGNSALHFLFLFCPSQSCRRKGTPFYISGVCIRKVPLLGYICIFFAKVEIELLIRNRPVCFVLAKDVGPLKKNSSPFRLIRLSSSKLNC